MDRLDKIFRPLPAKEEAIWKAIKGKIEARLAGNTTKSQGEFQLKEWKGYRFLPGFEPKTAERAYEEMEVEEGTVFVASFPKTGTTWTMDIVKQVLFGHDESLMAICKEMSMSTHYLETEAPEKLNLLKYIALPRKVFGTHLPEELINVDKIKRSKGKIIVTVRNPKDQAVSWFHFSKSVCDLDQIRDEFSPDWNQFILDYMSGKHPMITKPGKWYPDHLLGWYKHKDDDSVLFVQYEDLSKNPVTQVKRIAKFLGIELTENRVSEIVRMTSFDAMKKEQDSQNCMQAIVRNSTQLIREGQVGAWKKTFTVAQSELMDKILREKLAGHAYVKFTYQ